MKTIFKCSVCDTEYVNIKKLRDGKPEQIIVSNMLGDYGYKLSCKKCLAFIGYEVTKHIIKGGYKQ